MATTSTNTLLIKQYAAQLGFSQCGIAKAVSLDADAKRLEAWLHQGKHGNMQYMENHFEMRVNPTKLVAGAKSVITLLANYFPDKAQTTDAPKISKYAYGKDYHLVIKEKLKHFLQLIKTNIGNINGRGFVDSAPVLERSWATRSGLGWIGKNGNLITKQNGSFFFIATLVTDLELMYDNAYPHDYCGTCTKCVDACPTQAILPSKVVDGSRCISYFTIELKDLLIPGKMKGQFDDWMFGCDTCQDVCPWNRFSKPHQELGFKPLEAVLHFTWKDWEEMSEEKFEIIFKNSPIKRSKYQGIKRNIRFLKNNAG